MPSTTSYKQGDVLLAPFPFTDQSGGKQRPAVVLRGDEYNRTHPDVILAPITGQIRDRVGIWAEESAVSVADLDGVARDWTNRDHFNPV